jgi:hypothetical protein
MMKTPRLLLPLLGLGFALAACVASAQAVDDQLDGATGLSGHVELVLRCPVPLGGDDAGCADRPLSTTVSVRAADGVTDLAQILSDAQGAFWIALAPGDYVLSVGGRAVLVTVIDQGATEVTIRVPRGFVPAP